MKRFLALYMCPAAAMEEWMKLPPEQRKADEDKMKADWDAWMQVHGAAIKETAGAGKTKRVNKEGVNDVKNDVMLFSLVEAESQEAAATIFENHPHFGIPGATIDIMPANDISGM